MIDILMSPNDERNNLSFRPQIQADGIQGNVLIETKTFPTMLLPNCMK